MPKRGAQFVSGDATRNVRINFAGGAFTSVAATLGFAMALIKAR